MSFLSRSYERHFNERPYLNHTCYLFITKTTRERTRQQSTFNTLCRGYLTPKEVRDKDAVGLFLDAVGQAESIINESGLFKVERLSEAEIVGTPEKAGILEKYFALTLCLHTLSDLDDLPQKVSTDSRFERLSTDRSDCRLSFAAPVGLLLSCDHIYNQYVRQEVV